MTADTPTGPLVERVARALAERDLTRFALDDGPKRNLADAADLLRRVGIKEPAGLVWRERRDGDAYAATTPLSNDYEVTWDEEGEGWYAGLDCFSGGEIGDLFAAADLFAVAEYGSVEAAQLAARAACEADYAARMLAAGYVPADADDYGREHNDIPGART